ncbi:Arf-GAP domain-containing protein [Trichostrongylus colubriformis]|uniref:Arf-GAP domain-containing protein n=1 Tax=Trichostrongylus colubriformis TaxID=6319 RepID=A0AAN8FJN4_TRICO
MVNAAHVPSSNSTLSAQKKRQDEKNLKTLRELAALPANRFCFECGQRGPTYVNITHGSFCCTSCSGILRGLNPPHRVKSICMASFTAEEIERVRSLGNEENSHTWLGLYSGTPPKMTNKDEITSFLIKKYEKKEWYVSRSELEEQERLLNQAKEVSSQCGTSVKSAGSTSSKPSDLDLFATDPFAAFGAPMNRPVPQLFQNTGPPDGHTAQTIPPQPFSPPAFVAPPPPLPTKPPVQNSFSTQVSDPFAPVPPKNSTSEFDPFADFDAKFSELALKNSSTVGAFESPLPAQPLPKSATTDASFRTPQPASAAPPPVNPFQPQVREEVKSINAITHSDRAPITSNPDGGDKYSALAELDQMFHHSGHVNAADGEKPAWLPSGFSTGIPPAHYTPAFPEPAQTQRVMSSGFGSIPKSNTLGAIAEVGSAAAPLNKASFDMQQQAFSNSYANIASNPFVQAPFGSANPPQVPLNSEYPHVAGTWNNPFVMPFTTQPRYGADAVHGAGGVARQSSTPNWNPFA